jgi:hypothetical protein
VSIKTRVRAKTVVGDAKVQSKRSWAMRRSSTKGILLCFHFVCGAKEVSDLISHPVVSLLDNRVSGTSAEVVTKRVYLELFATTTVQRHFALIIKHSTVTKITVRPREIGTGGTGVTNHDNEDNRGSWLFLSGCARQRTRSSTFLVSSTFIDTVSESLFPIRSHGKYYLKVPLRVLVEYCH